MTGCFVKHGVHNAQFFVELTDLRHATKKQYTANHEEDIRHHNILLLILPIDSASQHGNVPSGVPSSHVVL